MDEEQVEQTPPKKKKDQIIDLYLQDYSLKEIAEMVGCSYSTVNSTLVRAKKKGELIKPNNPVREKKRKSLPPATRENAESIANKWEGSSVGNLMSEGKANLNRAAGWFVLECLKLGQVTDRSNPDSLYDSMQKYVALCTTAGMPMLVKTACLALGVSRTDISRWRRGMNIGGDERYREFAQMFDAIIGAGLETAAAAGSVDRILAIWWEKAHFRMTEGNGEPEEKDDPLGSKMTATEIVQKYQDLLPDDN